MQLLGHLPALEIYRPLARSLDCDFEAVKLGIYFVDIMNGNCNMGKKVESDAQVRIVSQDSRHHGLQNLKGNLRQTPFGQLLTVLVVLALLVPNAANEKACLDK